MSTWNSISILGAGNLGSAIADGITASGLFKPGSVTLTRRNSEKLSAYSDRGFRVTSNNSEAVKQSGIILIAVEPHSLDGLLDEIGKELDPEKHLVISVIAGVETSYIRKKIGSAVPLVRAAPNTAVETGDSMTVLCSPNPDQNILGTAQKIFNSVGETRIINEKLMPAATALCASGIAFFLRAIRAAAQAGVETGFSSSDATFMAAQTAKGAAELLLTKQGDPEQEIDRVTTPGGCTISGLNRMEKKGFSAAFIEGILHAAQKAGKLHEDS
ncbi:MAG: pyrroline-5-carboxylate reductase [Balneolaceae bacterium]